VETRQERLGGQTMVEQDMTTQARHWRSGSCHKRRQRRGNHGARHTTAHFPSRPKNHTAFLGLYEKVRRHPPCAVAFLPRVSHLYPAQKTRRVTPRGCQWPWLTAQTALVRPQPVPRPHCRIDKAIIRLLNINTVPARACPPTFGSEGSQETLPDDCAARVMR
jgi:hypothetical protein